MEISEIEQMIKVCNFGVVNQSNKGEILSIVDAIVEMRKFEGRFNIKRWEYEISRGGDAVKLYPKLIQGTLEDKLAEFAIVLFSLANKYEMNVSSLKLDKDSLRDRNFEDLMMSMLKIEISHYRIYKKIIVLLGMLCGYCLDKNIDLLWFVNKRLLVSVKG